MFKRTIRQSSALTILALLASCTGGYKLTTFSPGDLEDELVIEDKDIDDGYVSGGNETPPATSPGVATDPPPTISNNTPVPPPSASSGGTTTPSTDMPAPPPATNSGGSTNTSTDMPVPPPATNVGGSTNTSTEMPAPPPATNAGGSTNTSNEMPVPPPATNSGTTMNPPSNEQESGTAYTPPTSNVSDSDDAVEVVEGPATGEEFCRDPGEKRHIKIRICHRAGLKDKGVELLISRNAWDGPNDKGEGGHSRHEHDTIGACADNTNRVTMAKDKVDDAVSDNTYRRCDRVHADDESDSGEE